MLMVLMEGRSELYLEFCMEGWEAVANYLLVTADDQTTELLAIICFKHKEGASHYA